MTRDCWLGILCNSVNERDLNLLNSDRKTSIKTHWWLGWSFDGSWPISVWMTSRERFLEGLFVLKQMEVWGNNRSVMPLDVLGRTRATLTHAASLPCPKGLGNLVNVCRDRDRLLQLLILNEEFLVNASHQLALITSLPFVHTARRSYRLNEPVNCSDCGSSQRGNSLAGLWEVQ